MSTSGASPDGAADAANQSSNAAAAAVGRSANPRLATGRGLAAEGVKREDSFAYSKSRSFSPTPTSDTAKRGSRGGNVADLFSPIATGGSQQQQQLHQSPQQQQQAAQPASSPARTASSAGAASGSQSTRTHSSAAGSAYSSPERMKALLRAAAGSASLMTDGSNSDEESEDADGNDGDVGASEDDSYDCDNDHSSTGSSNDGNEGRHRPLKSGKAMSHSSSAAALTDEEDWLGGWTDEVDVHGSARNLALRQQQQLQKEHEQLQKEHEQQQQQKREQQQQKEEEGEEGGMPDIHDRKRILGCLASILAGMYSYDVEDPDAVSAFASASTTASVMGSSDERREAVGAAAAAGMASPDGQQMRSNRSSSDSLFPQQQQQQKQEQLREEYEVQQQQQKQQQPAAVTVAAEGRKNVIDRVDSSAIYSDQNDDSGEEEDGFFEDSFYGDDALLTTSPSAAAANRAAAMADESGVNRGKRGGSAPGIPDRALSVHQSPNRTRSERREQQQQRPPVRQSLQLGAAPSRLFPRRLKRHTTALAIHRHRMRRFEVMTDLLLSSAECLGLEERDVRGFLVMLEGMKTGSDGSSGRNGRAKGTAKAGNTKRRGRRRKSTDKDANGVEDDSSLYQSTIYDDRVSVDARVAQSTGLLPIAGGVDAEAGAGEPQISLEDSNRAPYLSGTVDASGWSGRSGARPQQQDNPERINVPPSNIDDNDEDWTNPSLIAPFLTDLTPGAGFKCISLLLLQHLLRSKSGYDARARHVFKRLSVLVLMWEEKGLYNLEDVDNGDGEGKVETSIEQGEAVEIRACGDGEILGIQHSPIAARVDVSTAGKNQDRPSDAELAAWATRKFEAIERSVASKLITLSNQQSSRRRKQKSTTDEGTRVVPEQKSQGRQSQDEVLSQQHKQKQQEQEYASPSQRVDKRRADQELPPKGERTNRRGQQQSVSSRPPTTSTAVTNTSNRSGPRITRGQIMRGLKIGGAGLAAGTLFAVTGGLAAPGIAAGIAAMTASTTITAAGAAVISTLTSSAAVCTIFGVGGGGLAAYKVSRRTKGVTEFEFRREDNGRARERAEAAAAKARKTAAGSNLRRRLRGNAEHDEVAQAAARAAAAADAELFSTVCLSGWFRDIRDFQRPWGVNPTNPPIKDRLELLERFYAIYQPSKIHRCGRILAHWRGEEKQLWRLLRQKYGRDPDHTFPFDEGSRFDADLIDEEDITVDSILKELGYDVPEREREPPQPDNNAFDHSQMPHTAGKIGRLGQKISDKILHHNYEGHGAEDLSRMENQPSFHPDPSSRVAAASERLQTPTPVPALVDGLGASSAVSAPTPETALAAQELEATMPKVNRNTGSETPAGTGTGFNETSVDASANAAKTQSLPRHLDTVWDYTAEYGGELYTVRWESDLLMELCDSVTDMVVDVLGAGTRELLKQTALATLVTAIAIPYAMIRAADSIDSCWTLAVERADEAGVELAKSLLESQAGHRPVTLLGYSMGARAIYSCLKELARHQEKWEDQRDRRREAEVTGLSETSPSPGAGKDENEQVYAREPASIVEDVILMGTPNHLSIQSWEAARRIVSGRLVNCYSTKDLILSVLFQYKRMTGVLRPVCGCAPVRVPGVENYDITYMLNSHQDYTLIVRDVLQIVRNGQPRPTPGTGYRSAGKDIEDAESDEKETMNPQGNSQSTTRDDPLITPLFDEKVAATLVT